MNWDAIAAVGETLGALAVFLTLGYLAIQVRHARSEARRALRQARGEALRELMEWSGEDGMSRLLVRMDEALGVPVTPVMVALMERTGLTRDEMVRVIWLQSAYWEYRAQLIPVADELSEIERCHFDIALAAAYGERGWARWFYEAAKTTAHTDMVRYIENVLARPG